MRLRRQHLVQLLLAVALSLGFASAAFACTALATLSINPNTGFRAGSDTTTTITGSGFDPRGSVEIRLDSLDSPPLASVGAPSGNISVTVVVPGTTSVGYHFFVATQATVEASKRGLPVRASFQVLPASASSSAVPSGPGHPHESDHPSDRHEVHPSMNKSSLVDVVTLGSPLGLAPLALSGAIGLVLSRRRVKKVQS